MAEAGVFPPLAVHMVRVGEETGRLEDMLLKVGGHVRGRHPDGGSSGSSPWPSPRIILVMGLLVGFIVVAMLLAIFSITEIPL